MILHNIFKLHLNYAKYYHSYGYNFAFLTFSKFFNQEDYIDNEFRFTTVLRICFKPFLFLSHIILEKPYIFLRVGLIIYGYQFI